eukprot:TRINITY_DN521_c2_g2_i2.p1 TRINITY_DN521_c2_g2~~TRINITY_DN521_c2_g2_i2.p1  ORF type:complete len:1065 (-),score=353.65 TRINITY_DN521_c2_g2_i2:999-4193(-)
MFDKREKQIIEYDAVEEDEKSEEAEALASIYSESFQIPSSEEWIIQMDFGDRIGGKSAMHAFFFSDRPYPMTHPLVLFWNTKLTTREVHSINMKLMKHLHGKDAMVSGVIMFDTLLWLEENMEVILEEYHQKEENGEMGDEEEEESGADDESNSDDDDEDEDENENDDGNDDDEDDADDDDDGEKEKDVAAAEVDARRKPNKGRGKWRPKQDEPMSKRFSEDKPKEARKTRVGKKSKIEDMKWEIIEEVEIDHEKVSKSLQDELEKKKKTPKYKKMAGFRSTLPAWSMQNDIKKTVRENRVVVISGSTGCGKSTQVPQFVLEDEIQQHNGSKTCIMCTQPRRIAAVSLAERVSDEMGEETGGKWCGYQIRLDSKVSKDTRLVYCTTGILLRRLQFDPLLEGVSHVIADEIHERNLDSDVMLVVLRDLLEKRSDLKLILMSATINAEMFSDFFFNAPTLDIPGKTFPVETFFLEDILRMTKYTPEKEYERSSRFVKSDLKKAGRHGDDLDRDALVLEEEVSSNPLGINEAVIDYELLELTIEYIHETYKSEEGSILVFLPGMGEIMKLRDGMGGIVHRDLHVIPLHSTISMEDQRRIFRKPPKGKRKVVISTNIAETSVTIDDVLFVLDTGRVKENRFDPRKKMSSLSETWVSRASAQQRAGRAGRVRPGYCFRVYSRETFENTFYDFSQPEILRVPLENICLDIQLMNLGPSDEFLDRAIQPPKRKSVEVSLQTLCEIGAMNPEDRSLTPLGYWIGHLPVDVRIGKLLILSCIFQVVDPILTIAGCFSVKSPFLSGFLGDQDIRSRVDMVKRKIAGTSQSDHITMIRAYEGWISARTCGEEKKYLRDNYLSRTTLVQIAQIRNQFRELLEEIHFLPPPSAPMSMYSLYDHPHFCKYAKNDKMIKAALTAGLYPNIVEIRPKRGKQVSAKSKVLLRTRDDRDEVVIHPSSVNYSARWNGRDQAFLVFFEKVKTTAIYLRDSTVISLLPLILFSKKAIILTKNRTIRLDDWIECPCDPKLADLIFQLREKLEQVLRDKIEDPKLDISQSMAHLAVVSTIAHVIDSN